MEAAGAENGSTPEHVIVLVLENRSFDHLIGHLDYPTDAGFDGSINRPGLGNHLHPRDTSSPFFPVTDKAEYTFPVDPDHEHYAVLQQLRRVGDRSNAGFVASYVHKAFDQARHETRRIMMHTWACRFATAGVIACLVAAILEPIVPIFTGAFAFVAAVLFLLTRERPPTDEQEACAQKVAPAIMAGFTPGASACHLQVGDRVRALPTLVRVGPW